MPDYCNCLIYKLCCKDLNIKEIYIGSTCNFARRKCRHKSCCNNKNGNYNFKVYQFIRDNGGWDNWDMILVEEFSCENKMQKLQRERYWYEELKADLNRDCPGRGLKEYRQYYEQTHKEEKREYCKQYRETHHEQIKEYRKTHKEEMKEYSKEYREINKQEITKNKKEYYETHKEKINENKKETITCECGSVVRKADKARHEKSKKHLDFINKN